jgi:hypothetical protein
VPHYPARTELDMSGAQLQSNVPLHWRTELPLYTVSATDMIEGSGAKISCHFKDSPSAIPQTINPSNDSPDHIETHPITEWTNLHCHNHHMKDIDGNLTIPAPCQSQYTFCSC